MGSTPDRHDAVEPALQRSAAGDAFSRFVVQVLRLAGELAAASDVLRWAIAVRDEETPADA